MAAGLRAATAAAVALLGACGGGAGSDVAQRTTITTQQARAAVTTTSSSSTSTTAAKEWVEVVRLEGSKDQESPVFELTTTTARLRYKANVDLLTVTITPEGEVPFTSEGVCRGKQADPCDEEEALHKEPGMYFVQAEVVGDGTYTVTIEELR